MNNLTINQIKSQLAKVDSLSDNMLQALANDKRKGVQLALKQRIHQLQVTAKLRDAFFKRFQYERTFWHQGINYIAGVDEVGRGPLAGPVVAGAVMIPRDFDLLEVNDSKQLSPKKRAELAPLIRQSALSVGIGIMDNHVIDQVNIYEATRLAMKAAVDQLDPIPQRIIVDAMQIDVPIKQVRLIKGDAKSVSVSAASIIAKVYRDHLMDEYARKYPEYDFIHNAGYGTKKHLAALQQFGATSIHRISFAPVKNFVKK
ncbi:ribonuclease HII [Nicoliella spurrieriana]|uniref:Ribonuclease HII n=1 Tax=Nicoliella spurrieriana TaxID=2925830 RepID=A0A976RRR0_9LACO|nr:ribonuclease HII [Nicoliella spurrieriana]UQS86574.1 ribonuclease HII [Nicoliella spurrieriana]